MTGDQLRLGQAAAYESFYSVPSMPGAFAVLGSRKRTQWAIYNLFMKKGRPVPEGTAGARMQSG